MSGEKDLARLEPGEIRASDTERRQVVATLQAACVEGRLNLEEYGGRVEAAFLARTRAQLEALVVDLPAETPVARAPSSISNTVAVLGSAQRSGFWRLAAQSRVVSVLGSCKIDLRSARVSAAVSTLHVASVLGTIDVIVPPGVEVELEVQAVLGARDVRMGTAPPTGAPVIRITGMVLLGSLNIRDPSAYPAHIDAYT